MRSPGRLGTTVMKPLLLALGLLATGAAAQAPRARDLGVTFSGQPGALNAITDVPGVMVGHATLISGSGPLERGKGPVRSGVTVVLPRGREDLTPVNAGFFNLNGNGEMTSQSYIADFGLVQGPIGLTETFSVGQVYAGIGTWTLRTFGEGQTPLVAETYSGRLSDNHGQHVREEHAVQAIDAARGGAVAQGNVGGGTGMVCFGFKGGIGTASRVVTVAARRFTVGVLVQCNTGARQTLRIGGVNVGERLATRYLNCYDPALAPAGKTPLCGPDAARQPPLPDEGSIIIVVATDAPVQGRQLDRLARRAALGLGRLGSYAGNGSGDLVVAFSTAQPINDVNSTEFLSVETWPNGLLDLLFEATVDGVEEAIVESLVAARDMTGIDGRTFFALPHDEVRAMMREKTR